MIFFHCQTPFVSILGLVDKGLRLAGTGGDVSEGADVSILGLVDKGLRQHNRC